MALNKIISATLNCTKDKELIDFIDSKAEFGMSTSLLIKKSLELYMRCENNNVNPTKINDISNTANKNESIENKRKEEKPKENKIDMGNFIDKTLDIK